MPLDTQTVNAIVQLGAVGVLILLSISLLIYLSRRPANSTDDTVLIAIANLSDKQFQAAAKKDELREKREEEYRNDRKEQTERFIASIDRQTVVLQTIQATNMAVSGSLDTQKNDTTAIKDAVTQMRDVGSLPLQDVQKKVTHISEMFDEAWVTNDTMLKANIQRELENVTRKLSELVDKLKTDELKKVVAPPIAESADAPSSEVVKQN